MGRHTGFAAITDKAVADAIDFAEFRRIADKVGAFLMADKAHSAGPTRGFDAKDFRHVGKLKLRGIAALCAGHPIYERG